MAPASVSFRITRSTEDLAHTIHALSQRLVQLEQRLQGLEVLVNQADERREQSDPQELSSLENVEQLLLDCRLLLGLDQEASPMAEADADDAGLAGHHQPLDMDQPLDIDHREQGEDGTDLQELAA